MRPAIDETFTIVPPPRARSTGSTWRIIAMAPTTLVRSWRSTSSLSRPRAARRARSRIVHEHVEAAEALHGGRDRGGDAGLVRHVEPEGRDARPGGRGPRVQRRRVARRRGHLPAAARHELGGHPADARRGAGDEHRAGRRRAVAAARGGGIACRIHRHGTPPACPKPSASAPKAEPMTSPAITPMHRTSVPLRRPSARLVPRFARFSSGRDHGRTRCTGSSTCTGRSPSPTPWALMAAVCVLGMALGSLRLRASARHRGRAVRGHPRRTPRRAVDHATLDFVKEFG
jgi:hypothetical protein